MAGRVGATAVHGAAMNSVSFHTGLPDKLLYACRLVRKARRAGARVTLCAEASDLGRLDALLWSFDPLEFLPHVRAAHARAVPARLADTPVLLLEVAEGSPARDVLVHLGAAAADAGPSFGRWIELVADTEDDARAARQRWRHYQGLGHQVVHHVARG